MARVTQASAPIPIWSSFWSTKSFESLNWMSPEGRAAYSIYGRQAFKIDGKFKSGAGSTVVDPVGGGPGPGRHAHRAAKKRGIEIRYQARGMDLLFNGDRIEGIRIRGQRRGARAAAKSVVLA